jgi:lipopolysaccharide export system protein LptA
MNFSVERLRVWLLAGAGLLVVVIAAFLGYAHYRANRFIKDLPGKLGVDIRQETNGFTYSQSVKGRTIYTIHAAKAVQRKDGKVTLHDVGIVLYGRGDGSADRVDRIYGSEFEYDQNAGLVRAMGEVHIDLQAPMPGDAAAKVEYAKGHEVATGAHEDERLIHVKTSGLVFLQKLGVAATDQDLEFTYSGMTGKAHGAEYNSDSGLLVLQSAVNVSGMKNGEPTVLTASRAELDRLSESVVLTHATYTVVGGDAGSRVAKAERVKAMLRHGGSVERVLAEGGVSMTDGAGATVTATRGEAHMTEANQPQTAMLAGSVRYGVDEALRQTRGEAEEAHGRFDKAGRLEHAVLTGAVHLHERTRAFATVQAAWSERDLTAKKLDLGMVESDVKKRLQLREAKASGNARLTVQTPAVAGLGGAKAGWRTDTLSGDVLTAEMVAKDGSALLKSVHGVGHTALQRVSGTGAKQMSSGDTLDAEFPSAARTTGAVVSTVGAKRTIAARGRYEVATVVQQGHVLLRNQPMVTAGITVVEQSANADRAVFDGDTAKVTLTGTSAEPVRVLDGANVLTANRVVMEQQTGDAAAEGTVRAIYTQDGPKAREGSSDPVHVLASRAELKHDAGETIFYGSAGAAARLWQGGSQISAPVLEFEQQKKRMHAIGSAERGALAVHTVFVNGTEVSLGKSAGKAGADSPSFASADVPVTGTKRQSVVRVTSREATYDDASRRADFTGGVIVESADGTMRGQLATVYLQPAKNAGDSVATASLLGGKVERVVMSGKVEIMQPGRRATGQQVVYTAQDGMLVMTGLPGAPPKMIDEARGAITGASLRFHAGDNSVVVSNGTDGVAGQRVRTETRVKQ